MKNSNLFKLAAFNSLGVLIYVSLISIIINNGERIFGSDGDKLVGPIIFLLLFVFSALLTGFLILGKPIMLYFDGQKKEGVKLLFYTGGCLFIFLVISLTVLLLLK